MSDAVGVPGHQVGGIGREGHVAAVGADRGVAGAVRLRPAGDAHPPVVPVTRSRTKTSLAAVGVARHQIRGRGLVGH